MNVSDFDSTFRFVDESLQRELLGLAEVSGAPHTVDADGTLRYSSADEQDVWDDLICSVRDRLFPEWRIFTLEGDDVLRPEETEPYRRYMLDHNIPHYEERHNGFTWFLIPDDQDSHEWEVPSA